MLQVFETVFNAEGEMQKRDAIVVFFQDRKTAAQFLQRHLEECFVNGKCGYHEEDDYWWACDDKPEMQLYRYTIE